MSFLADSSSLYGRNLGRAFDEAAGAGIVRKWYRIGGASICLQFAGDALVPLLTPALDHLVCDPCPAELTISVWDTCSTGIQPPDPVRRNGDMLPRGEIRGHTDGDIRLTWHPEPSVISFIDRSTDEAVFWIEDARKTPYYESGSPFRSIFHWLFTGSAKQLVHAAAVGGVLIAGKGGSGKSNSALSCIGKLPYAADDYCMVESGSQPYVHSLYSTAKVDSTDLPFYPHLSEAIANTNRAADEKALLYLHRHRPQDITTGFPLRAILVPRLTGRQETTVADASPAAALQALAPSTIFQLPGAGDEAFRLLSEVCRRLPCYFLNLGTDRTEVADAIAGITAGEQ